MKGEYTIARRIFPILNSKEISPTTFHQYFFYANIFVIIQNITIFDREGYIILFLFLATTVKDLYL